MNMQDAQAEYAAIFLPARNLAPRTRSEYAADVAQFAAFLAERGITAVEQIGPTTLDGYLAHLDGRGLAGSTRRRKVASLRSFCKFLVRHKHIPSNPALELIPPGREQHIPTVLSTAQYKRLRETVAYRPRDAAIIELMLQTGIRLSELTNLTLGNLTLPTKISKDEGVPVGNLRVVQGKGRKPRDLSLNYLACLALKAYLAVRPKTRGETPDAPLFLNKYGQRLKPRPVQKMLEKYLKEAKIEGASPHALRHTFATHMVKSGAQLRSIQEMLGHTDLKTTSIYISLAREQLEKDVQRHAL